MRLKCELITMLLVCLMSAVPAGLGAAPWDSGVVSSGGAIRAEHIKELRNKTNDKRQLCGKAAIVWAESITAGVTRIRKQHIDELRDAILDLYPASPRPTFPDITAEVTPISATHINDLRNALDGAPPCCVPNGTCSAAAPACGKTTTGADNCGNICTKTGAVCCVPNGTCSAAAPACGQTTTGKDNCGATCTKTGAVCPCVPNPATCNAPAPACGQTTTGTGNCGACTKVGTPCCVPNGTCSAAAPTCGQTTTGKDNCGATCTKTGSVCCVPNGTCSAATPACGQTTTGKDNCGVTCTKKGSVCPLPCKLGTLTVADGSYVTAYQSTKVCYSACVSEKRVCNNGALSGSYPYIGCAKDCACYTIPTASDPWTTVGSQTTRLHLTTQVGVRASGSGSVSEPCLTWLERTGQWHPGGECPSSTTSDELWASQGQCMYYEPSAKTCIKLVITGSTLRAASSSSYPTSSCTDKFGKTYRTYVFP